MIAPRQIVAFLQNPWFYETTHPSTIQQYRDDVVFRRIILSRSMTGQRLVNAFGSLTFDQIWWDNANPRHSSVSSGKFSADEEHIIKVLLMVRPKLVITFGTVAQIGVIKVMSSHVEKIPALHCHHPNARGKTQNDLINFAKQVGEYAATH